MSGYAAFPSVRPREVKSITPFVCVNRHDVGVGVDVGVDVDVGVGVGVIVGGKPMTKIIKRIIFLQSLLTATFIPTSTLMC